MAGESRAALELHASVEGMWIDCVKWQNQIYTDMHAYTHVQAKTQAHMNPNTPNVNIQRILAQNGRHDKRHAKKGKALVCLMCLILVRLQCWLPLTDQEHHG